MKGGAQRLLVGLATVLSVAGCNCGGVASEEDARRAYLGLDRGVDRAIQLGLDGYNAASSANIPPQTGSGEVAGTMTVSGQVDQGSSANKGLRLDLALKDYQDAASEDVGELAYTTPEGATPPRLELQLKGIPDGTFSGTLSGVFVMTGALEGDVVLALTLDGDLESAGGDDVRRKTGTTRITGTATSEYGDYAVDLTR